MGVIVANKGFVETAPNGDRFAVLLNGRRYEGTPGTLDYRTVDFARYAIRIEPKEIKRDAPKTSGMTTLELVQDLRPDTMAELHWRIALPIAVLVMALFAIPLSFVNPRSGRSFNLVLAVHDLFSLLQPAQHLPGVDALGKDPRLGGPLARAPRDDADPRRGLLQAVIWLPVADRFRRWSFRSPP